MRIANTLHIGNDSVQQVVAAGNGLRQRLNDLLLRGASSPRFTCGISAMVRATASAVSFRPSRVALLICIYHKAYTSSSTAPMTLPIIKDTAVLSFNGKARWQTRGGCSEAFMTTPGRFSERLLSPIARHT